MCNKVMWDQELNPVAIPETGVGWKVFYSMEAEKTPTSELLQRFGGICGKYRKDSDGWIRWEEDGGEEQGFCFFLKKEDAEKMRQVKPLGGRAVIRKIEYQEGVQERDQMNIVRSDDKWRMAICKRFRILEEE